MITTVPEGYELFTITGNLWKIKREGGGSIARCLQGAYTRRLEAENAIRAYELQKEEIQDDYSDDLLEILSSLTKKADLKEFAEKLEITIPSNVKMPAQIKAYLKEIIENAEG